MDARDATCCAVVGKTKSIWTKAKRTQTPDTVRGIGRGRPSTQRAARAHIRHTSYDTPPREAHITARRQSSLASGPSLSRSHANTKKRACIMYVASHTHARTAHARPEILQGGFSRGKHGAIVGAKAQSAHRFACVHVSCNSLFFLTLFLQPYLIVRKRAHYTHYKTHIRAVPARLSAFAAAPQRGLLYTAGLGALGGGQTETRGPSQHHPGTTP